MVCVIDKSGSMGMESKLEILKSTMISLLEILQEKDRLAIVTFDLEATCISEFKRVDKKNIPLLRKEILKIESDGGTNIGSGMAMALSLLK